jgi:hypothetical protein
VTVTNPADLVRDNCDQMPGYIDALFAELLLAGRGSADGAPVHLSRSAAAPLPGDAAAFYALTTIWEAIPRIEARLRYELNGHPGERRGGSGGNLLDSLAAIPKLAAGLDEDAEAWAARALEWLGNLAREHPGIDEAEQWRPVQARACPFCGCYFLKVLLDAAKRPAGRIECFGHLPSGAPCRATWARLADIVPDLARADEPTGTVPDLEGETG